MYIPKTMGAPWSIAVTVSVVLAMEPVKVVE
jgi:hypothetical protein